MNNAFKIIIGVVLSVILVFIIFYKFNGKLKEQSEYNKSIRDRIFKGNVLLKKTEFEVFDRVIRFYKTEEKFYLIGKDVVEYSLSGDMIKTIGKNGPAPWENGSVWYFDKVDDGYYVIDRSMKMIKKFFENDSLDYYFLSENYIDNGVRLNGANFLYAVDNANDFKFVTNNIEKNKVVRSVSIKSFITNEFDDFPDSNRDLVFEGNYSRNSNGEAIYYMYKFGLYIVFKTDGTIKYFQRTIDKFNMPKPVEIELGSGYSQLGIEPDNFVNYSACMDLENIFILSNVLGSKYSKNRVVDVYSVKDGSYQYTIKLPARNDEQMAIEIAKSKDQSLSVLYENMTVVTYKLNEKIY